MPHFRSVLFSPAGFFIPFLYLPTVAQGMQIEKAMAAFLISIIGIANTVGRVMVGYFSDKPWVDPLLCNNFALIIGGAATITVPWIKVYGLFAVYAMVFGTSIGEDECSKQISLRLNCTLLSISSLVIFTNS